jgi:ABC-type antimicrobial peptide transport system permease subunit
VRGRAFTPADAAGAQRVLLVNEAFTRRYFPGEDAIGQTLHDRGTIVGIVGDVRQTSLDRPAEPELYYPVAQNFAQLRSVGSVLVVRSAIPAESLLASVREAIREVSPDQPTFRAATMREVVNNALNSQRFYLTVMGVFAGIGTALAAAGIYGVMAYAVALRTREFGIRLALGADAARVVRLVVSRGAVLVGSGLAIGVGGALLLARFLSGLLYGVAPTDPGTLAVVAAALALVAITACLVPARKAGRVDPVIALRAD